MNEAHLIDTIRHFEEYEAARKLLAAHFTTVAERKDALVVRDDFHAAAPGYVRALIDLLSALITDSFGEECADPDSCDLSRGGRMACSRCRLVGLATLDWPIDWAKRGAETIK